MNHQPTFLLDLFLDCLADMYYAEHQQAHALPKMASEARDPELKRELKSHLIQTEDHIKRVEQVFGLFGEEARMKKSHAIAGLLADSDEMALRNKGQITLDAALIAAAQKIEHYEIASYGTLLEWAAELGNRAAAEVIKGVLAEERLANNGLTELAESSCNVNAQGADARQSLLGTIDL